MGKRLYRIFEKDIPSRVNSLKNTEISVVLKNNKTFLGLMVDSGKGTISLKDSRMSIHHFAVSEIAEIVYDGEAPF